MISAPNSWYRAEIVDVASDEESRRRNGVRLRPQFQRWRSISE